MAIYIKKDLLAFEVEIDDPNLQIVKLILNKGKHIIVINVYISHNIDEKKKTLQKL